MTVPIPATIRQLLACPRCHGALRDEPAGAASTAPSPSSATLSTHSGPPASEHAGLVCDACQLRFPVRDGIPVMLLDQATPTYLPVPSPKDR
ncbi:MAG TPA: Trm112 family protein [Gemmatimonadaceae bacterium]|nr:Trm112 family protein [Gemmatimonadaceae bacterium]